MLIVGLRCPHCEATVIVDRKLWGVGTVPLHCGTCGADFTPSGSPKDYSVAEAANASVDVAIWPRD